MLRAGDRVTLGVSPTVEVAPYQFLKPTASVTRTLGDDVDGDIADMQAALTDAIYRATEVHVAATAELMDAIEDGGLERVLDACERNASVRSEGDCGVA